MNSILLVQILLMLAGLYTMIGGITDWEWFMSRPRAMRMVNLIGRSGARIFYIVTGGLLFAIGSLGLLGIIPLG